MEVRFVEDSQKRFAFHEFLQGTFFVIEFLPCFAHEQDEVGLLDGFFAFLDAQALDQILAFANPRGIQKTNGDALNGKVSLDHVPRGPRNIRDDGFVLFQKGVKQRRFPDVRFPNEG